MAPYTPTEYANLSHGQLVALLISARQEVIDKDNTIDTLRDQIASSFHR
jgi:hypothetical protein